MAADTDVALAYLDAGWPVFPLPLGHKYPPPEGRTGGAGSDMARIEVELFSWPPSNIGVRTPPDVIGLDVDAYRGGLETLRALIEQHGKLPPTFISHSGRDDGSGIRFYRVPWGLRFVANLPGIEVIQRHHRYAVVWPSVHPDGREYGWWDVQAEAPAERVPAVADLPELPWSWIGALAVVGDDGRAPVGLATPAEVEAYVAAHVEELAPHYLGVITSYYALKVRDGFSRHDTMTHCLIWAAECARAAMFDAGKALNELHELWLASFNVAASRRPTSTEWPDMVRHAVAKAAAAPAERIEALFIDHVGFRVDPSSGSSGAARTELPHGQARGNLPERFWQREAHHVVRSCAALVGVSAEALMLGVLAAVALHVPPVVRLPGKRYGQVNLLACVVGPPGAGKGTTLDRALQLVPPPPNVRPIALGTPQGLVRAFYERPNVVALAGKPPTMPLERHSRPVIVRTDEVAAYAAATNGRSAHGDGMLAHLKGAVSGEGIGGGYAADDRNLALAPHSYRLTGVLGIAPAKAAPLFDDLGGGLPERLLFAPVLPPQPAEVVELPAMAVDDHDTTPGAIEGHRELPALGWRLPALDGRQAFTDSASVAGWLEAALRHPSADGLDAHRTYLTHQVAALLAVLDGRWTITGSDLALAGDVLDVSVATRRQLLDAIEAEGAKAGQARARAQLSLAVDQAKALDRYAEERERLAMAQALVEEVTEQPGVTVKVLRDRVRSTKRRLWDMALAQAVADGLIEERSEGEGGHVRRTLWPRS